MPVVVLCPTRGRPQAARETAEAFLATVARPASTKLRFVVDDDDPDLPAYKDAVGESLIWVAQAPGCMNAALNQAAVALAPEFDILGFIGDDHRFRSQSWDVVVEAALAEPGFAYGDDLFQRERLATQVFISSPIVQALGWMAPPRQKHLYLDDAWMMLGRATSLVYMPEVIIEHMHPLAGKGEWDDGYRRVNAQSVYDADWVAYEGWKQFELEGDVEKIRAAIARP